MQGEPKRMLRRLAAGDEQLLAAVMVPAPEFRVDDAAVNEVLDRRTRLLVRVAALLAVGAPTAAVEWAVELASGAGAGVETLTGVLLASARAVGTAGVVESAPRLAVALGFDVELEGWDGS